MPTTPDESPTANDHLREEEIFENDILARAIFYNTSFEGEVVGLNSLLAFRGNRNLDGSFSESLFLARLTDEASIHTHGCMAAKAQNARVSEKRSRKGLDPSPVPGDDRRYYCGFSEAEAKRLLIEGSNYKVDLLHERENGLDSHVHIYLRPKSSSTPIAPNDRTEASRLLARHFRNVKPCICSDDDKDSQHPIKQFGVECLSIR